MPKRILTLNNSGRNIQDILPVKVVDENHNRILQGQHSDRFVDSHDGERKVRKNFFPYKLMEILSSPFFADCIHWKCGGRAFLISDTETFLQKYASVNPLKEVLRKKSFTRKLNRWGFKKDFTKGPNYGVYSHKYFIRDNPQLCELMECKQSPGSFKDTPIHHIGSPEGTPRPVILSREVGKVPAMKPFESVFNFRAGGQPFTNPMVYNDGGWNPYVVLPPHTEGPYKPSSNCPELAAVDYLIQERFKRIRELNYMNM